MLISRKLTEEELKAILSEPYIDSHTLSKQIGTPASTIRAVRQRNGIDLNHKFNPDVNDFVALADEHKGIEFLANYYNRDRATIIRFGDKLGLNLRKERLLNDKQIQEIIDKYDHYSSTVLSKEYGVSIGRISQIWAKAGLKGKDARVYTIKNENIFKTIDNESAYLLGFIGADGCLYKYPDGDKRQDVLSIIIQRQDRKILELFQEKIQTNKPISESKNKYVSLQISSNIISEDLRNLNISYRKTYENTIANIPNEYMPHLIRGYFDGDGSIKVDNNMISNTHINISGYYKNLIKIQKYLETRNIFGEIITDNRKYQHNEENPFGLLILANKTNQYCFLKLIYNECGDYYMDRKKEYADQLITYIENSDNTRDKQIVIYYNNAVYK